MKTILKSLLYVSLTALILTGCANNDDFSTPNMENCKEPAVKATKHISDIYTMATSEMKEYKDKDIISGVIVSSDAGGNFYKDMYLVSEDGNVAMRVKVNKSGSYGDYPVGRVIHVSLQGLYFQLDNNVLTIGEKGTGSFTQGINNLNKHLLRSCTTVGGAAFESTFNNKVTLKEATSDKYLGKLVTISDVQFKKEFWGKTYFDKDNMVSSTNKATNVGIISKQGDVTANVIYRVAEQSGAFKNEIIPAKSGTMTGVMTKFSNDYQFVPRVLADIKLTQDPFDSGTGPEDPNIVVEPGKFLAFPGADFENWNAFLGVIIKNTLGDPMATEGKGAGWNGSTGLNVSGVAALNNDKPSNGSLFTVEKVKAPKDATKISFLMKGKAGKSLSINLFKGNGVNYYAYNLENVSSSVVLKPNMAETVYNGVPSGNTTNNYTGKIDTNGKWVKVILDFSSIKNEINTSGIGSLISFRYGHTETYDLVIDEIRFEDGTEVGGGDPVDPIDGLLEAKSLTENFDDATVKGTNYSEKDLDYASGTWSFIDGGVFKDASDLKSSGEYAVRLRGTDKLDAVLQTKFYVTGLKKVEFKFGGSTFNEGSDGEKAITVEVFYSKDSGKTWLSAGTKDGKRGELSTVSFDINDVKSTDKVVVKIQNVSFLRSTNNRLRINIDDVKFIK